MPICVRACIYIFRDICVREWVLDIILHWEFIACIRDLYGIASDTHRILSFTVSNPFLLVAKYLFDISRQWLHYNTLGNFCGWKEFDKYFLETHLEYWLPFYRRELLKHKSYRRKFWQKGLIIFDKCRMIFTNNYWMKTH